MLIKMSRHFSDLFKYIYSSTFWHYSRKRDLWDLYHCRAVQKYWDNLVAFARIQGGLFPSRCIKLHLHVYRLLATTRKNIININFTFKTKQVLKIWADIYWDYRSLNLAFWIRSFGDRHLWAIFYFNNNYKQKRHFKTLKMPSKRGKAVLRMRWTYIKFSYNVQLCITQIRSAFAAKS